MDALQFARARVNTLCESAKKSYYRAKITENEDDQKTLYRITDELLCKKKPKALPTFEDPKDMANKTATFCRGKN